MAGKNPEAKKLWETVKNIGKQGSTFKKGGIEGLAEEKMKQKGENGRWTEIYKPPKKGGK